MDNKNLKLSSFFDKLKKQSAIQYFKSDSNADTMYHQMASLSKYDEIRSVLKNAGGVVNFVTNDQPQPLIELIIKSVFSNNNDDLYSMGTVMSDDDFSVDCTALFGERGDPDAGKAAVKKMESILFGSSGVVTKSWFAKNAGLTTDEEIKEYLKEFALKESDANTILAALNAYSEYKLAIENNENKLKGLLIAASKAREELKAMGPDNIAYNEKTNEVKHLMARINLARQFLAKLKNGEGNLAIGIDIETGEADPNDPEAQQVNVREALSFMDVYSGDNAIRNDDGLISHNEASAVGEIASKISEQLKNYVKNSSILKSNKYKDEKSGNVRDLTPDDINGLRIHIQENKNAIKSAVDSLRTYLENYYCRNKETMRKRNELLDFIKDSDSVVSDSATSPFQLLRIIGDFVEKIKPNGRTLVMMNPENSSLCTQGQGDKSVMYDAGVLSNFISSNRNPSGNNQNNEEQKAIVMVSGTPIENMPYSTRVEMIQYPVDEEEATVIVNSLSSKYTDVSKKFLVIKMKDEINRKYKPELDDSDEDVARKKREKIAELSQIEEIIASGLEDISGSMNLMVKEEIEDMIVGLPQNGAITLVENVLRENSSKHYDDSGIISGYSFDTEKIRKDINDHINKFVSDKAIGLEIKKPVIKFDEYSYKSNSEWALEVKGIKSRADIIQDINGQIKECINKIDFATEKLRKVNISAEEKETLMNVKENNERNLKKLKTEKSSLVVNIPHVYLLYGAPGVGKCLGRGTPVMMADGGIKEVEEIKTGDLLMGPDSKPRTVLSTIMGTGPLYKVSQKNGDDYICNDKHILSLHNTYKDTEQEPVFISAENFCEKSKAWKHKHKGWKVGVDFLKQDLPLDPYWLGLWLGDGVPRIPSIIVADKDTEIADWLQKWADDNDLFIRKESQNGCSAWHFTEIQGSRSGCVSNKIKTKLRELNLLKNKHIPDEYLKNSKENRLKLLAGLIDSDGYKTKSGSIQFTNVNELLAEQCCYLARSVGLRVSLKDSVKTIKKINYSVVAYTVTMGGNLSQIPVQLERKKGHDNPQKKSLRYGINVEPIGNGEYFGFEIDGDRQFLLGDFTVTHNTVWADALCDLLGFKSIRQIKMADTRDKWLGNTEKHTQELINVMSACRNTVFLLDELDRDLGGGDEPGAQGSTTKSAISKFLEFFNDKDNIDRMTNANVFFIITTNKVDELDTALSARIATKVEVELPDDPQAYKKLLLSVMEVERRNSSNPWLYFDGAESTEECWEKTYEFLNTLDMDKFCAAMAKQKISFRKVQQLLHSAFINHQDWQYSKDNINDGKLDSLFGFPMTTDNLVEAALLTKTEVYGQSTQDVGNIGTSKLASIKSKQLAALKEKLQSAADDNGSISYNVDDLTEQQIMEIMNGNISLEEINTIETLEDDEDYARREIDEEVDSIEDDSLKELDVYQEKEKVKDDGATPDIDGNDPRTDEEEEDSLLEKSSSEYIYNFLKKKGVIKTEETKKAQLQEQPQVQQPQINNQNNAPVDNFSNLPELPPDMKYEYEDGVYLFQNDSGFLIAPANGRTPPQHLKRDNRKG